MRVGSSLLRRLSSSCRAWLSRYRGCFCCGVRLQGTCASVTEAQRLSGCGSKALEVRVKVTQSCLCDPVDCSPPVCSVHGIFRASMLQWVAISSFSKALGHMLNSCGSHAACGVFLDQGSNLCLLHWWVDSLPLSHQGSPGINFKLTYVLIKFFTLYVYDHATSFASNNFYPQILSPVRILSRPCPLHHETLAEHFLPCLLC